VANGPTNSLVAWEDMRISGSPDIFAARVRADGTVLDPAGRRIAWTSFNEEMPCVTSGAGAYHLVWRCWNQDTTVFAAARLDTAGNITRLEDWFGVPGADSGFDAVQGSGADLLLLFSYWTDSAAGRAYDADRLWGRFGPFSAVAEGQGPRASSQGLLPTIVRDVLLLPRDMTESPGNSDRVPRPALLNAAGRKSMELIPGANDVRQLAPGVYFVRRTSGVAKVVLTR